MAIKKTTPGDQDGIKYAGGAGTEEHDGIKYPEEHRTFDELARGGRAMARHHEEHEEHKERAAGGRAARASGGRAGATDAEEKRSGRSNEQGEEGTGDPEFFGGAESPSAKAAHGDEKAKKGGRIKRKERKRGGRMAVDGKDGHKRLDRAHGGRTKHRAMGGAAGGIGSDKHPLTEANKLVRPKGDKMVAEDDSEDD